VAAQRLIDAIDFSLRKPSPVRIGSLNFGALNAAAVGGLRQRGAAEQQADRCDGLP
jgi:hypothetical protein